MLLSVTTATSKGNLYRVRTRSGNWVTHALLKLPFKQRKLLKRQSLANQAGISDGHSILDVPPKYFLWGRGRMECPVVSGFFEFSGFLLGWNQFLLQVRYHFHA